MNSRPWEKFNGERKTWTVEFRVNGAVAATMRYGMGSSPEDAERMMARDHSEALEVLNLVGRKDAAQFVATHVEVVEFYDGALLAEYDIAPAAGDADAAAAIDAAAAADAVLPDLTDPEVQDAALELLVTLEGFDFGQGSGNVYVERMITAIHNKLYDEWSEPVERPTAIDAADADDWLHLQRDGFDVFAGARVTHTADELDGRPSPDLTDDEYQRLIDVICAALEV